MRLLKNIFLFLTAKNRIILPALMAVFVVLIALLPIVSSAQIQPLTVEDFGISYGAGTGLGATDARVLAANIIKTALGLLGIIAVVIVLYAGFLWMTSMGEAEKIDKAKKMMINGAIGLLIILASYAITVFVFKQLIGAINGPGNGGTGGDNPGGCVGCWGLGGGILRNVYPEPNAKDVPRNVKIMVMFSKAMDPETVIDTKTIPKKDDKSLCPEPAPAGDWWCGSLAVKGGNPAVRILKLVGGIAKEGDFIPASDVAIMTKDKKNFVIIPNTNLAQDSRYSVNLTTNWRTAEGDNAFMIGGYTWSFEVGNFIDETAPRVESVFPGDDPAGANPVKRNATIQVNFSEPINIIGLIGKVEVNNDASAISASSSVQHFQVSYKEGEANKYLSGDVFVSNGFKTAEFISDSVCLKADGAPEGENSCGVVPTCLPTDKQVAVLLQAAKDGDIFSGITDVSGNSLDGDNNGVAGGDYSWSFKVGSGIDLSAPYLLNITPGKDDQGVPVNSLVKVDFSERISGSTLNNDNVRIFKEVSGEIICNKDKDFPLEPSCYPTGGFTVNGKNIGDKTSGVIKTYFPYLDPLTKYNPRLTKGVKDLYQNCLDTQFPHQE